MFPSSRYSHHVRTSVSASALLVINDAVRSSAACVSGDMESVINRVVSRTMDPKTLIFRGSSDLTTSMRNTVSRDDGQRHAREYSSGKRCVVPRNHDQYR